MLQGILEQKLKPPCSSAPLCSCCLDMHDSQWEKPPLIHGTAHVIVSPSHSADWTLALAQCHGKSSRNLEKNVQVNRKSSGSHAFNSCFKDALHWSAVIILACTFIFQCSNSAKKSCGEGSSSLYRSTKSVSYWAVIWLCWITDGTNPSSLLTLTGYHAYQVWYAYRSGQSCQFIWRSPPEEQSLLYETE